MNWELIEVSNERNCKMDDSGIYTTINRVEKVETHKGYAGKHVSVRVDVMTSDDMPLISFIGAGNAVRKEVINWLYAFYLSGISDTLAESMDRVVIANISSEHASYIGYEIARAESDVNYKQN